MNDFSQGVPFGGVLQTIVIHKWALKKNNVWVIWAWLGYVLCPLTIVSLIAAVIFGFILGQTFIAYFAIYTALTLAFFTIAQSAGVLAYSRKKARLLIWLPAYVTYSLMMQIINAYLVFAYVTKIGVKIRYGGKIIHAIH